LLVEGAKLVEGEMIKPLKDLIGGIEVNASGEQIVHLLYILSCPGYGR
jgi:hypothetical protein